MKKIVILSVIIATAFVSCKKDYLCSCSVSTTSPSGNTSDISDTTFANASKSEAKSKCNSLDSAGSNGGFTWNTECEIK